jgi:hypothetical protein
MVFFLAPLILCDGVMKPIDPCCSFQVERPSAAKRPLHRTSDNQSWIKMRRFSDSRSSDVLEARSPAIF